MDKLKQQFQRQKIAGELKQKEAVTDSLIHKILYSKRLLVDHVESLDQCLQQARKCTTADLSETSGVNNKIKETVCQSNLFTSRNACILLGTTILEHFITPKELRITLLPSIVLTTGFGVLCLVKSVFVCRNKMVERDLDKVIKVIDDFSNCIHRNMTYFQEITFVKQQDLIEITQMERAWDCISSIKEVTEILFDATRKMEEDYLIPMKYLEFYAPMEELKECEYFKKNVTDYSPKNIKDFHNIFAYVQSQYFLRLALTVLLKPSLSKLHGELYKTESLIRQLLQEEENHFRNLIIDKKTQFELEELNAGKILHQKSGPIATLQHLSLNLSARMVAVATKCQALDIALHHLNETIINQVDNTYQLDAANNMQYIENALSECCDDFQRLMLVYNKLLNNQLNGKSVENQNSEETKTESDEFPESILRVEISQSSNSSEECDNFFAYMYDGKDASKLPENQETLLNQSSELLNFEKRITKTKFKPVLKQLKDRIHPIKEMMLEKERVVLSAKGINIDEFFNGPDSETELNNGDEYCSESEDGLNSENCVLESKRKINQQDKFSEMRNFLTQKQAINLFKLVKPLELPKMTGEEELLESEC